MGSFFFLLGSNLGDRLANLQEAQLQISRAVGRIITASSTYKTAAWGNVNQPEFYNQAIEFEPLDDPHATLLKIQEIEKTMGRVREERWGSRLIDIDILIWDQEIVQNPDLIIPHAQLQHRRFALVPLVELAPDFVHPVLKKSFRQLLAECTDTLAVTKIEL